MIFVGWSSIIVSIIAMIVVSLKFGSIRYGWFQPPKKKAYIKFQNKVHSSWAWYKKRPSINDIETILDNYDDEVEKLEEEEKRANRLKNLNEII